MADVQPYIDQLNAQVKGLTSGDSAMTFSPADLANIRKDVPGIELEYKRASGAADPNSPAYKQKGLDSLDNYTSYWYGQLRNPGDYTYNPGGAPKVGPEEKAKDLTAMLKEAVDSAVSDATKTGRKTELALKRSNTKLTNLITTQAESFKTQQGDLLKGFQDATAESSARMADLVKQLETARNGNSQAEKQPNYAAALKRNKELNSGGLSSTMITGAKGVPSASLTLGRTSLLGA